jgi:ankyrin repeat protein
LKGESQFLIRKFLNDLMEKHQFVHEKSSKNDFKKEIENCCRENLIHLLKYFTQQNETFTKIENNQFLIIASGKGHKETVVYLLEKEIDVNIQNFVFERTALIEASIEDRKEIVQLLLDHKDIDVNKKDGLGETALSSASSYGQNEILRLLLAHKDINVNEQNNDGECALKKAVDMAHARVIVKLINYIAKLFP